MLTLKCSYSNILEWSLIQNTIIVIGENAFANMVCSYRLFCLGFNVCNLSSTAEAHTVQYWMIGFVFAPVNQTIIRINRLLFFHQIRKHFFCLNRNNLAHFINITVVAKEEKVYIIWNALQWRHNGRDGVSNHRRLDCLLNCVFRPRSRKKSKLRVNGLCEGNSPVTGGFPSQRTKTVLIQIMSMA